MIISLKGNGGGGTAGVSSVNGKSGKITLDTINGKDLTAGIPQTVVQSIMSGDKGATIDSNGRAFLRTINGQSLAGNDDITIGGDNVLDVNFSTQEKRAAFAQKVLDALKDVDEPWRKSYYLGQFSLRASIYVDGVERTVTLPIQDFDSEVLQAYGVVSYPSQVWAEGNIPAYNCIIILWPDGSYDVNHKNVSTGGGSGNLLKSVDSFPETAEYGDVVSKAEEYKAKVGSWTSYPTGTTTINNTLKYDSLWSVDDVLLALEWFGNHLRLKYTDYGTIIFTDNKYADVFEEVYPGENKTYTYYGITDTSRQYALSVNWSEEGEVVVSGPNVAIEQTFADPTTIEYKYGMYEYVHLGDWAKVIDNTTGDNKILEIGYEYFPEDKGNLHIANVVSNGTTYIFEYVPEEKVVRVGNTVLKEGVESTFNSSIYVFRVLWEKNIIRFTSQYSYPTFTPANFTLTDMWRKISDDTKADAANVAAGSGIPHWNSQGIIDGKAGEINRYSLQINNSSYSNMMYYFGNTSNPVPRIYAPTAAGTSGQVLVSGGDNVAPSWMNHIKSVEITEDAYEALAVKDNNTLYLIVDE